MSVASSYAKAFMQAIRETGAGSLEKAEAELADVVEAIQSNPALKKVVTGFAVSKADRVRVVDELAKKMNLSPTVQRFLTLLTNKQRVNALVSILDAFKGLRLESEGAVRGKVVSADPLSDTEVKELSASFEKRLGKKVVFDCTTNGDLIAGLRITVGGVTYDGTLASQLKQIRSHMLEN